MKNNWDQLVQEWLSLGRSGATKDAETYYYNKLFPDVQKSFVRKFNMAREGELLISMLGYSPEPIILTAMAMKPTKHVIVTTSEKPSVNEILERYLEDKYQLVIVGDDSFAAIYGRLKDVLFESVSRNITIDVTGGKKSHVAAACIFGKDYGCRIVYVDFKEYLPDLRRPIPGSEILNLVYDPLRDEIQLGYSIPSTK